MKIGGVFVVFGKSKLLNALRSDLSSDITMNDDDFESTSYVLTKVRKLFSIKIPDMSSSVLVLLHSYRLP